MGGFEAGLREAWARARACGGEPRSPSVSTETGRCARAQRIFRSGFLASSTPPAERDFGCATQMFAVEKGPWTMNVALNRKRSRLALEDDEEEELRLPEPSPALSTFSDALKRTRTQSDLEELGIIRPEDAWSVDVESILSSHTLPTAPGSGLQAHSNVDNFQKNTSIIVLCVQGNLHLHYDLLW